MEHRCSVRRPIEFQVLLYKHGLPVQTGISRNLGMGGVFVEAAGYDWQKNEYLEVEVIGANGKPLLRLPAVVVHYSGRGAGLMFDAVSTEQRRILRGWLFGEAVTPDVIEEDSRAVA
jgi:hypothetical protein